MHRKTGLLLMDKYGIYHKILVAYEVDFHT